MREFTDPTRFIIREDGQVRVRIVEAAGTLLAPGVVAADPPVAQPNFGREGWMDEEAVPEGFGGVTNPKITLDDGTVLWGYQCWWEPVERVVVS